MTRIPQFLIQEKALETLQNKLAPKGYVLYRVSQRWYQIRAGKVVLADLFLEPTILTDGLVYGGERLG